mgnify:CR=1 FL=1
MWVGGLKGSTCLPGAMQSGPSGPPSGPSGPPKSVSSGPPGRGPPKRRSSGPPGKDGDDEGAFSQLADRNLTRQRELDRREQSKSLKRNRNLKRWNVVFMVCLFIIFGVFAWLPVTYGDTSDNPHDGFAEIDLQKLHNPNHPMTWQQDEIDMMDKKIWDGDDQFSGAVQHDLNLYGFPMAIDGITTVPLKITLVSYREDGQSTNYRIGMFPERCSLLLGDSISDLPEGLRYVGSEPLLIDVATTIELNVPAGRYCFVFEYIEPVNENGWKATVDAKVQANWPRPLLSPLILVFSILAVFGFIGAQRAGKAWKEVAQPERAAARSLEDEVLDAAEEERGDTDAEGPSTESAESVDESPPSGPPVEPQAEPPSGPPVAAPSGPPVGASSGPPSGPPAETPVEAVEEPAAAEPTAETTSTDTVDSSQYTDEMLHGWGWNQQQIEDWRAEQTGATEAAPKAAPPDSESVDPSAYTDEMLIGWGWTSEQIEEWRAAN